MIAIIPGIGSSTPIPELLEGEIYHIIDIIRSYPEDKEVLAINQELAKNSIMKYDVRLAIAKSYGTWVLGKIHLEIPKILISPPTNYEGKVLDYLKVETPAHIVYSPDDPLVNVNLLLENKERILSQLVISGDHSLRPITNEKCQAIREHLQNNLHYPFSFFNKDYEEKRTKNLIKIIPETFFYTLCNLQKIKEIIDSKLSRYLNQEDGPITAIVKRRESFLSEDPSSHLVFYQSNIINAAKIFREDGKVIATGGMSVGFTSKEVLEVCLYEALERYSLALGLTDNILKRYDQIPENLRPPEKELIYHDQEQSNNLNLVDPIHSPIDWTVVHKIETETELLYPVQLLLPHAETPLIRQTTSTGTAFGRTKEMALVNGLREAIERHSNMSWFYQTNHVKAKKIDFHAIEMNSPTKKFYGLFINNGYIVQGYLLSFFSFTTVCIIAHKGNHVAIGSCCNQIDKALEKALSEAIVTGHFTKTLEDRIPKKREDIQTLVEHILYYQDAKNKNELLKYLDSISNNTFEIPQQVYSLSEILKILKNNGHEIYYKNLTAPELRQDFFVSRVIVFGFLDMLKRHDLSWNAYYAMPSKIPDLPDPFP